MSGGRIFRCGLLGMLAAAGAAIAFADDDSAGGLIQPPGGSFVDATAAATVDALAAVEESFAVRRLYVSGIVGASFASLASGGMNTAGVPTPNTGTASDDLFSAGGAIGVAFDRPSGLLRAEVEGRGRERLLGQTESVEPFAVAAADSWSAMANLWRDLSLTTRFGVYGGGGIGAAGYRLSVEEPSAIVSGAGNVSQFAWQAGAGATYTLSPQITLDLGYRFVGVGTASTPLVLGDGSPAGDYTSAFTASEVLLSLRIYEPFRAFRR
jgi:opacity protein-like surface antigen